MTLNADAPDTVAVARNMARDALTEWDVLSVIDDVRLVVSELVGNAINHAVPDSHLCQPGAPRRIEVVLRKWPKWLFVAVSDEDSSPPTLPSHDAFSPEWADDLPEALMPNHGRGLLIVANLTQALWWTPKDDGGKTVYCRFDIDPFEWLVREPPDHRDSAPLPRDREAHGGPDSWPGSDHSDQRDAAPRPLDSPPAGGPRPTPRTTPAEEVQP
ncbi:ATP-binding protein [Streptomyces gamaensis]|uniref:ATP-binding protein n=1 Tax=Streptomyces gamaensis TaxID=1763542 RepID=A0ABW0YR17_9ACTN